jgi:hypothetical protein
MMISTKNLSQLPNIPDLLRLTKALAALETIMSPKWERRYYSFNANWDQHEQMASARDGEGNGWFCVFGAEGAFLTGRQHDSQLAALNQPPGKILAQLTVGSPDFCIPFIQEPAFSMPEATFCIWRDNAEDRWNCNPPLYQDGFDADGSGKQLKILDGDPLTYQRWAEGYYRASVDISVVARAYRFEPFSEASTRRLNPDVDLVEVAAELSGIGFPFYLG